MDSGGILLIWYDVSWSLSSSECLNLHKVWMHYVPEKCRTRGSGLHGRGSEDPYLDTQVGRSQYRDQDHSAHPLPWVVYLTSCL